MFKKWVDQLKVQKCKFTSSCQSVKAKGGFSCNSCVKRNINCFFDRYDDKYSYRICANCHLVTKKPCEGSSLRLAEPNARGLCLTYAKFTSNYLKERFERNITLPENWEFKADRGDYSLLWPLFVKILNFDGKLC